MVDLDGTILLDHKNISDKTLETIERLLDKGIEVVPTTGRYYGAVPNKLKNNKRIHYVASLNGAEIYDNKNDKPLLEAFIDQKLALEIIKKAESASDSSFVVSSDGVIVKKVSEKYQSDFDIKLMQEFHQSAKVVDNIYEYLIESKKKLKKIEFSFKSTELRDKYYNQFINFENIDTVSSNEFNIEITAKNTNKGTALHFLKDYLKIKTSEVLAIGDSENDISMLEEAGISVAMANANKEVKSVSDFISKSYLEDGFTFAIKKCLKI